VSEQGQLPVEPTGSDEQNVTRLVGLRAIVAHSDLVSEAYWELIGALNPSSKQFQNMRESILLLQRELEVGALDTRIPITVVVRDACEVLLPLLRLSRAKLDSFEDWHKYHMLLVKDAPFDTIKESYTEISKRRDACYTALEDFRDAVLRAQAFLQEE
jgi:hypothetical protein